MGCINSKNNINNATYENTPTFSFNRYKKNVKVLKVYDGDTIWIAMNHFDMIFKIKVRLDGIDTPEIRTKDMDEKNRAIIARDFLSNLINNKIITLECGNFDKYGRLLGTIYLGNINVNKLMVVNGHAVEYDGGKKLDKKV